VPSQEHDELGTEKKSEQAYLVVQWLDLFLAFPLTDLIRVCHLEELRGDFHEPLWFYGEDVMAVLACGEYKFMIYEPFRCAIE